MKITTSTLLSRHISCSMQRANNFRCLAVRGLQSLQNRQPKRSPHALSQFSSEATQPAPQSGAWTLLAALEKSIEAQGVHVARLISAFEVLLPRPPGVGLPPQPTTVQDSSPGGVELHQAESEHSNDPAFFSFVAPHLNSAAELILRSQAPALSRQDVVDMLYATRHGRRISLTTLQALIRAATWQNQQLPNVVTLPPLLSSKKKVTVVGDLHGSLSDLEAVLAFAGEPSENHVIVFNGDLADRGDHGIEVIAIACALSLAYPNRVYINRGNHEDVALSIAYGLALEVRHKYGQGTFSKRLAPLLDDFFRSLPLATVVQRDALIVHGGPPPPGIGLKDILKLDRYLGDGYSRTVRSANASNKIDGEASHNQDLIVEALVWSDPSVDELNGTLKDNSKAKTWKPNKARGAGFKFDSNVIRELLKKEGLFRMVRSHEPVQNGCVRYTIGKGADKFREFFTVFSASRYPKKEGFNRGAILTLLPKGEHHITRYETEDDEPVRELSKVLTAAAAETMEPQEEELRPHACDVDSVALRRALSEAMAAHRAELEKSLKSLAALRSVSIEKLPFHDAVDVLINVLHLEGEGLCQPGPRLALAKALSKECDGSRVPETIDLLHVLDECLEEQDVTTYSSHLNWLHAIFSLVDSDHDGVVSKEDWEKAVATINANLPKGSSTGSIDADETWAILDVDNDGFVTAEEWDSILLDVSLTSS